MRMLVAVARARTATDRERRVRVATATRLDVHRAGRASRRSAARRRRARGATNIDRSIVAVWGAGPVHVFDASGTRLATIKPWAAGLAGNRPSMFREAHVLGSTIEVRIADTPISSAIRLYDARGNKIADVFGGKAIEDSAPPLALGGSTYAFISLDAHSIVITDVATGKQLGSYPLPGEPLTPNHLMRTPDGNIAGMVGATVVMLDVAAGKLSSVAAPACEQ